MAKKARTRPLPQARPIILCRDVLVDPANGNVHLIGIFNAIRPAFPLAYPHRPPEFCVFLQLTDAEGNIPGHVQIVEPESRVVVHQGQEHTLHFHRRTSVVRAVFRIKGSEFPSPGVYLVEFYCDGRFLADHPLRLQPVEREAT